MGRRAVLRWLLQAIEQAPDPHEFRDGVRPVPAGDMPEAIELTFLGETFHIYVVGPVEPFAEPEAARELVGAGH